MMFLLLACTNSTDTAEEDIVLVTEGSLQFLSYNVHGLPPAVTEDDTPARIAELSPMLNAFQLVGLQEDWDIEYHSTILENTVHPYDDYFDDLLDSEKVYGSGLAFLSQLEVLSIKNTHYLECSGYLDGASDCFASKGFQRIEIPLNAAQSLYIYNTHLEAGGGDGDNAARDAQITQLLEAFAATSDMPMVFIGDMNLHGDDPLDIPLLERLYEAGLEETCLALDCSEPNHIDKIFSRSSPSITLTAEEWRREESFVDGDGVDLSDHPAISSRIHWQVK